MTRLKEILPFAAILAAGGYLYYKAMAFAAFSRPGLLGPDVWPKAILTLLLFVCVVEIARRAWSTGHSAARPKAAEEEPQARYRGLLAAAIALTVLYVPALELLGFFLATVIYLAAFMAIGRYRRWRVIAATSVLGSFAFVYVFMKIVYVSLPLGAGPFRAFSAAILSLLGIH